MTHPRAHVTVSCLKYTIQKYLCLIGVVGRDYYGVFPLKGKLLNVREALHAQIMKNEEVQNIAKILGYVHCDRDTLHYCY